MPQRIIPARSREAKLAAKVREAFSLLSAVQPLCGPLKPITPRQAEFVVAAAQKTWDLLYEAWDEYRKADKEDPPAPHPNDPPPLPYPEEGAERSEGETLRNMVSRIGRPVE